VPSPPVIDHVPVAPVVEGYPLRHSVRRGEVVEMCCSSSAPSFAVEIARIGAGREVVWRSDRISGSEQAVPDACHAVGCDWPVTFEVPVGAEWRSGFYEVVLHADGYDEPEATSHSFFVVRTDASSTPVAPIVLMLATNTYNAYNTWGGGCLYTGATQVSFHRPMDRGFVYRPDTAYDGRVASIEPDGDPDHHRLIAYLNEHRYPMWCASSGWHNWERRFVRWAERAGFTLDVAVNSDLELHPDVLDGRRLLLSVGHDEYWSWAMRDTVDAFVAAGGNHAVFSGNTSFWQVRLEDGGRTMVGYKSRAASDDPVVGTDRHHLRTSCWSDPAIGRPETSTFGLTFSRGGYARVGWGTPRSSGGYTIHRPEHWAFAGTGLCWGDVVGSAAVIVGYEVDGCAFTMRDGRAVPTHEDGAPSDLEILATAPARLLSQDGTRSEIPRALWADPDGPGDLEALATVLFGDASPASTARIAHNHAVIACFTRGRGTVFHAGTTDWSYGLDSDPTVQRITRNVLEQLSR
jgi:hypothetical protein